MVTRQRQCMCAAINRVLIGWNMSINRGAQRCLEWLAGIQWSPRANPVIWCRLHSNFLAVMATPAHRDLGWALHVIAVSWGSTGSGLAPTVATHSALRSARLGAMLGWDGDCWFPSSWCWLLWDSIYMPHWPQRSLSHPLSVSSHLRLDGSFPVFLPCRLWWMRG